MEILTTLDPEILSHIESLKPSWEKQAAPEVINKLLAGLDPDLALDLYLEDKFDSWMNNKISEVNGIFRLPITLTKSKATTDSEEVTIESVRKYLSMRYSRYKDYAEFHTSLAKMDQESIDVLNESLLSTLLMPEEKLISLFSKKKKDQNLCDLDFYVLRTIKLSCHSSTSPYQWKYHNKKHKRSDNEEISLINEGGSYDVDLNDDFREFAPEIVSEIPEDTEYFEDEFSDPDADLEPYNIKELICTRFQIIRDILEDLPISEKDRNIFRLKFFLQEPWKNWRGKERVRILQRTFRAVQEMVIEGIAKKKEEHTQKTIHELFQKAKRLKVPIIESEFLILRKYLSEQKADLERQIVQNDSAYLQENLKVISLFEKRLLFIFSEQLEAFSINHKF
jgi:hypothetical protein